jgi:hypothetical protein
MACESRSPNSGAKLVGAKIGKGCITFAKPETIDLDVLEKLLEAKRNAK